MSQELSKIPTLQELINDKELYDKQDALTYLLNQPVPKKWVKKHPFINIKVNGQNTSLEYVPIERVKMLLNQLFPGWCHEITNIMSIFNAVCVTVRLRVINPVTGKEIIHDGVGAVDVQTKAGESPADLSKINASAVMKAAPAAESYALKNAAEKLGNIFGGALQKYDLDPFVPLYNKELKETTSKSLREKYGTETDNK